MVKCVIREEVTTATLATTDGIPESPVKDASVDSRSGQFQEDLRPELSAAGGGAPVTQGTTRTSSPSTPSMIDRGSGRVADGAHHIHGPPLYPRESGAVLGDRV